MSEKAEQLKKVLAELSAEDRAELLDYLAGLEEVEEDLTREEWEAAWAEEINRRVEEIRSGRAKTIPGDEVFRRIDEKLGLLREADREAG